MKSIFFLLFFNFFICHLLAQISHNTLYGNVLDNENLPIAYASIVLETVNGSIIHTQGDLTDEQGKFNIPNILNGKYKLSVSFVGYQSYSQEIEVNGNMELPTIQLQAGLDLNEIVVSAQKKRVSYKQGKISLAVENSKLAHLPTATDVLSFVPGIIVQGNDISVVGRTKTLILINGKEVKSTSQIESLQPEMIKNITLDRNPSAKYDASYNSVISITTKQNLGKDFSAQYIQGGAVNHHLNHSETLNLNHVNGKFSNFLSYKFKNSKKSDSANTYQHILLNDGTQTNSYDAAMTDNNDTHSLTFGSNIKLNEKNTADIQYSFNGGNQKADISAWEKMEENINKILNVNRIGNTDEQNHTVNLNYQFTIDSIRSLQFFGDYTRLKNASSEQIISENQILNIVENDALNNRSTFDVSALRAEYNTKLFSGYDFLFGAKYSVIRSNALSKMAGENVEDFFNTQSTLTESNIAAYTTLSRQFDSFYTELGLRTEFTHDKYYKNRIPAFDKPRNSAHLFPSFLFNYDFSENLQLNLSYTSKIQRPAFSDLDPSLSYLSSVLYSQGNPELKPMTVHTIELGSVIKRKFNISAAYKIQKHLPAYMIEPSADDANILLHKPVNILQSSLLDFTATYTFFAGSLTSNLIGNIAVPFVEYPYNGKIEKNNIPLYQIVTMNQYAISPSLLLFCNFGFKSQYSSINTIISPTYRLTAGVNWILMKGKMILTMFGNDLFHKSEPAIASKYGMVDFGQTSNPDTRMLGITLKYNFNGFRNIFRKSDSNQQDLDRIIK